MRIADSSNYSTGQVCHSGNAPDVFRWPVRILSGTLDNLNEVLVAPNALQFTSCPATCLHTESAAGPWRPHAHFYRACLINMWFGGQRGWRKGMSVYFFPTCSKDLKERNCYEIRIYIVTLTPISRQCLDEQAPSKTESR
jgi:hypothetical protein